MLGYSKRDYLIGTINLVSSNKGLEYVIYALPSIIKAIPHIQFLMIGQTHPMIKVSQDEAYRHKLRRLIKELGVKNHVVEINKYISLSQLVAYLQALDIYLTPYLDMSQTTSGTLAYAIGAGKVCIATPYIYAKEVLHNNRGILIPPRDSEALAKEVIRTYEDPTLRQQLQKNAYDYGRTMIWDRVATQYLTLISKVHL